MEVAGSSVNMTLILCKALGKKINNVAELHNKHWERTVFLFQRKKTTIILKEDTLN